MEESCISGCFVSLPGCVINFILKDVMHFVVN